MKQNVLITGTGREMALGFNFVRRYLEQGEVLGYPKSTNVEEL